MMKDQPCTSFEIVDAGDIEKVVEQPFIRESLGGGDPERKVKATKTTPEPVDEVDADSGEEEEAGEDAGSQ